LAEKKGHVRSWRCVAGSKRRRSARGASFARSIATSASADALGRGWRRSWRPTPPPLDSMATSPGIRCGPGSRRRPRGPWPLRRRDRAPRAREERPDRPSATSARAPAGTIIPLRKKRSRYCLGYRAWSLLGGTMLRDLDVVAYIESAKQGLTVSGIRVCRPRGPHRLRCPGYRPRASRRNRGCRRIRRLGSGVVDLQEVKVSFELTVYLHLP
jgi:hypothetical protein